MREPTPCCCVLVWDAGTPQEHEGECEGFTTGPDDPFCMNCTTRHQGEIRVDAGVVKVIARIPRRKEVS